MNWRHESVLKLIEGNQAISSDPIEIIKQKAQEISLASISNGWSGPPYNMLDFTRLNGINTNPNMHVSDARIFLDQKDSYTIEYNPYNNPKRINFSIAHEVGHTFFSDCHEMVRNREIKDYDFEDNSWELEFLCNIAASEILLPSSSIFHDVNTIGLDYNGLVALSEKYQVSLESLLTRIPQVVEKPCATAIAFFDQENPGKLKIKYSNISKHSGWQILPDMDIPKDSSPYDCVKPGWSNFKLESWGEIDQNRINVYSIGLSPLQGEILPRVGLLITPERNIVRDSSLKKVVGDATQPTGVGIKIIAQVVNTAGGLGAGFGKAMAQRYPITRRTINQWKKSRDNFQLGATKLVELDDETFDFLMIAQAGLNQRLGQSSLDYSVLKSCLNQLTEVAKAIGASVHMPLIGAGQAKGNWNVIENIVYDELVKNDVDVTIYILPGTPLELSKQPNPTLFD